MAYKVIILYQLYMPSYFLGTFTEYPYLQMVGYFPTICKTRFLLKTFFRFCISYRLLFGKMKNMDYISDITTPAIRSINRI